MARRSRWLSSLALGLWLGSFSAAAQAPGADTAAEAPVSHPPAQAHPREARRAATLADMEERPWMMEARTPPKHLWRIAVEAGGTGMLGRVDHYADGKRLPIDRYHSYSPTNGAFDFRLTVQRVFGNWFALGGQLGWTNWQSVHLDETNRLRSDYLSLAVLPELRLPLGRCRRCPALLVAGRGGVALAIRGEHEWQGGGRERSEPGVGAVWGARAGIEVPLGSRVRLRFSTGYEGALLRHRVTYRELGSEVLAFRIQRPMTTLGVSVGL